MFDILIFTDEVDDWQWIEEWKKVLRRKKRSLVEGLILDESMIDELSKWDLITEDEREDLLGRKIREESSQHLSRDERADLIRTENNQYFIQILFQKSPDDIRQIIKAFEIRKKTAVVNCLYQLLGECFERIHNTRSINLYSNSIKP